MRLFRVLLLAIFFVTGAVFAASTEAELRLEFLRVARNEVVSFTRFNCWHHLRGRGEEITGFLAQDKELSILVTDYVWIQTNEKKVKVKLSQIVPSSFSKQKIHGPPMGEVYTLILIALRTAQTREDDVYFRINRSVDRNRWNEGGKVRNIRLSSDGKDYIIELSDDMNDLDSDIESVLLSEIDPSSFDVNLPLRAILWRALGLR